jgi:hypothetical protein
MNIFSVIFYSPFTTVSIVYLIIMMLIKIKKIQPHITDIIMKKTILVVSLIFISSGLLAIIISLLSNQDWYIMDIALGFLIVGLANTGWIANRSTDPFDSAL